MHANDHCNYGQSSNDIFPTGMHIAAYLYIKERLIPSLEKEVPPAERTGIFSTTYRVSPLFFWDHANPKKNQ